MIRPKPRVGEQQPRITPELDRDSCLLLRTSVDKIPSFTVSGMHLRNYILPVNFSHDIFHLTLLYLFDWLNFEAIESIIGS